MKRFARSASQSTVRFIASLVSFMTCCFSHDQRQHQDKHMYDKTARPALIEESHRHCSISCDKCIKSISTKYVEQAFERNSTLTIDSLRGQPQSPLVRTISTQSRHSDRTDHSVYELDISGIPPTIQEITYMRRMRAADHIGAKTRVKQLMRLKRFARMFGRKRRFRNNGRE